MAQNLSNLPVGSLVKFGKYPINGVSYPIVWMIVAKNHSSVPAYPSTSVTLLSKYILDCLAIDVGEPSNTVSDVRNTGNAEYQYSNLDQWLNKDTVTWYVPAHTYDQAPNNDKSYNGRGYTNRAAFLNGFSSYEKKVILDTTIRVQSSSDTKSTYDIVRKVFLPSCTEMGGATSGVVEGSTWEYFATYKDASMRRAVMSSQLYADGSLAIRPQTASSSYAWWLRSPYVTSLKNTWEVGADGRYSSNYCYSEEGVRPAMNLTAMAKVSDTTDADGCYTFIENLAPSTPSIINVPTIYGGKANVISWSGVSDPDGDVVTYQLECSMGGGAYTQIYSGTSTSYSHLVTFGTSNVVYRVKAIDPSGESSGYATSSTVNVINNYAPVISGADANLGVKSSGFTGKYTITDANNNTVTVTEAIDGIQIRTLVATLGQEITYGVTETTWLGLPNGSHTLTITATDGIDTTVRRYTFTKLVESFTIQNTTPLQATNMPSRIMVVVTRNIPSSATFKVEVCNNGYDASPTWEDATNAVLSGLVHVFANKSKTASNWGVIIKVTVERNGATGACYVSAIGGNFE